MIPLFRRLGASKYVRSVVTLATGAAVAQIVSLAASPLLSRLYSPSDFGTFAVYSAVLGIAVTVGSWRLDQAIGLPKREQQAFCLLLLAVLGAIVTAILVVLVGALFPGAFGGGEAGGYDAWLLSIIGFGIVLSCTYQAAVVWALRHRAFQAIGRTRVAQSVGAVAVQILLGMFGAGGLGLASGHTLGQSIGAGSLLKAGRVELRLRRPRMTELWVSLRRFRRFPLMATPAALLNSVALQVPVFLLTVAFGAPIAGQYFFAQRIAVAPLGLFGSTLGQVFYSDAVKLGRRDFQALRRLVLQTCSRTFALGTVPVLILTIFGPSLFPMIFGAEWGTAGEVVRALGPMLLANFIVNPISQVFLILEKQWVSIVLNIFKLSCATGSLVFAGRFGWSIVGSIWAYSGAMTLYYLAVFAVVLVMLGRHSSGVSQLKDA